MSGEGCENHCVNGVVECWNPGGPCDEPNRDGCDTCGPCNLCHPVTAPEARDALVAEVGKHVFQRGWMTLDGWQKHRCACGHVYDSPNATELWSHPQHLADALLASGLVRTGANGADLCQFRHDADKAERDHWRKVAEDRLELAEDRARRAWSEGVLTALVYATRNEDGITLSLDHEKHPNPFGEQGGRG